MMIEQRKIRYLMAGGWNTLFGYVVSLALYNLLEQYVHIIAIAIIAHVCAISMAYFTYKVFVFRTKGNWWKEYKRSYLVYGNTIVVSIGMLWFMVDILAVPFWIAQGLIILTTVILSYIGHSRYTFSNKF